MKKYSLLLFSFFFLNSLRSETTDTLDMYGSLNLNDSTVISISLQLVHGKNTKVIIEQAGETPFICDAKEKGDSLIWRMPLFNSVFLMKMVSDEYGTRYDGVWHNCNRATPIDFPFHMMEVPPPPPPPPPPPHGTKYWSPYQDGKLKMNSLRWEATFSPGTSDSSKAIGMFTIRDGHYFNGTFQTETGDYRYLEGSCWGMRTDTNTFDLTLQCFDGAHAFVFKAKMDAKGNVKEGHFWSGKTGYERWIAKPNPDFRLRDPLHLTYVVDSSKVNFTFNDLKGKPVSLSDPQFKGKVVIIQVMGSWCPNCMDETAEMTGLYKKYHDQGLEVVAIAYERSQDTAISNANIRRVMKKYGAGYTFLNTGKTGSKEASESLPFLNGIMSFPTSIYIDRSGNVREVYTGYNGPATGEAYLKDKESTEMLIQQLLSEKTK